VKQMICKGTSSSLGAGVGRAGEATVVRNRNARVRGRSTTSANTLSSIFA